MKRSLISWVGIFLLATVLTISATDLVCYSADNKILGRKPDYGWATVSSVSNSRAIGTRIWVPGLDEGFVPQGLTFADGQILISLYQSKEATVSKGPCRVYRVDPVTGNVTGQFDLPKEFGHADGLAYGGSNILYASDTHASVIYKINLEKALKDGSCNEAILGEAGVDRPTMSPAFLTYDGSFLWFGRHNRVGAKRAKVYKMDPGKLFSARPKKEKITSHLTEGYFEIDYGAQGAVFDKEGYLWVAYSDSKWGKVQKIDASKGSVIKEHELMAGLEDFACAPDGRLWSVSEAGAFKYLKWKAFYPLIFEIDQGKLK
jgi:sugar lactone lactonase YvrE